ncbi:MAG: 4Fe-4S dicluster domain-containing protein [Anaeromyxobacteraceae bacterium]
MGHLGRLKEEYRDLVTRLDKGTVALPEPTDPAAWHGWREILETLYTPEEASLAARLPWRPTSLGKLSRRLGIPEAELAPRLDAMCDKGVVMDLVHPRTGKVSYLLSPPVVGFFEYSLMRAADAVPKKRMAEALHAYTHGDEAFAREALGRDTVVGRALVHETALGDEPLPDVLDWERATHVVGEARAWAVSLCYCRHKMEHLGQACDAPMDACLTLNGGAEFVTRRGFGRAIERSEALDVLAASRASGLVQIADNVQDRPTFVCNCCGCCCEQLQAANRWGLRSVNGSGFAPRHDDDACSGCSRCARACPVAAVEMAPSRRPAERRNALAPRFDLETCIGCGVCATACHKGALRMERGGARRPVPLNSVEKAIRQALERNRLAELLFDAGEGLGSRFLAQATRALTSLPVASRVVASEQVRSRFVRAALSRFREG